MVKREDGLGVDGCSLRDVTWLIACWPEGLFFAFCLYAPKLY
jgi:hypothetical protein